MIDLHDSAAVAGLTYHQDVSIAVSRLGRGENEHTTSVNGLGDLSGSSVEEWRHFWFGD